MSDAAVLKAVNSIHQYYMDGKEETLMELYRKARAQRDSAIAAIMEYFDIGNDALYKEMLRQRREKR